MKNRRISVARSFLQFWRQHVVNQNICQCLKSYYNDLISIAVNMVSFTSCWMQDMCGKSMTSILALYIALYIAFQTAVYDQQTYSISEQCTLDHSVVVIRSLSFIVCVSFMYVIYFLLLSW